MMRASSVFLFLVYLQLLSAQTTDVVVDESHELQAPTAEQFRDANDLPQKTVVDAALDKKQDADTAATDAELTAHTDRVDNPHTVTAEQVGAYTEAETDALLAPKIETVSLSGGPLYPDYFVLDFAPVWRGPLANVTTTTVSDAELQIGESSIRDYQAEYSFWRYKAAPPVFSYSSSDEAVATVSADGLVERVADGTVDIITTLGGYSRTVELDVTSPGVNLVTNIVNGVSGSLRRDMTQPVLDAITADAGAIDNELFDTRDWSAHTYVRNASCWAYTVTGGSAPWTGLAVWATAKTTTADPIRGTLISPDVVTFAWANRPQVGDEYKWLGTDDQVYTREITAVNRLADWDAGIGLLDSALPAEVAPIHLIAPGFLKYFLSGDTGDLPVILVNRNLQAGLRAFGGFESFLPGANLNFDLVSARAYQHLSPREDYDLTVTDADVGSPALFVVSSDLVLLFPWSTPTHGYSPQGHADVMSAITKLGGEAPTIINITAYPNTLPGAPQ
jgi:hypothetical protein